MTEPTNQGQPGRMDRGAWNTHAHPGEHASDVHEEEYTYHNPWPMTTGQAAVSDGNQMQPTDIATQAELDAHAEDTDNPHAVTHDQLGGVTANQHHNRAHTLGGPADHSDVDVSGIEVGQTLVWTGLYWIPGDVGRSVVQATAGEALIAGDFVQLYDDGGALKARPADASLGRPADGYVMEAADLGAAASVYLDGLNDALAGLTVGADVWLSTAGDVTETAPTTSGYLVQRLGRATAADALAFAVQTSVLLA